MHVEIIAIGDELMNGQRVDTNSQWLSDRLGQMGVAVRYHAGVGDDLDAGAEVFRTAIERSDIVVSTGGLGPTMDDLARDCLAAAMGVELELDEASLEHIRELFRRRGREMPKSNERQAFIPTGSRAIPNPHGSAPGIAAEVPRADRKPSRVFSLPGVPTEMREMWFETVQPAIAELAGAEKVIRHREIKCFGMGESHLEQQIGNLVERGREPAVGITVHEGTITLRITASGESEAACFVAMEPVEQTIRERLGDVVMGVGEMDVAHVIGELLAERRKTLAIVEYGTEGWLSQELTRVAANAEWFRGGVVRPEERMMRQLAGAGDDVQDVGSIASLCRTAFEADYALTIGPFFAAAKGDSPNRAQLALATPDGVEVKEASLATHPAVRAPIAAKQLMNMLRLKLLEQ